MSAVTNQVQEQVSNAGAVPAFVPSDKVVRKLLSSLRPSPENDCLYDRNDADILKLAALLEREQLRDPLVITQDNYILSGHRRYAALTHLGRVKVPCRVAPFRRADVSKDDYIREPRIYNRYRDRSVAEKMREALVDIDTDDAYESLRAARDKSVRAGAHNGCAPLLIEGASTRHRISAAKGDHVRYVTEIIMGRRKYWPLSVRGVHYPLLNFDFVRGFYHPKRTDPDWGGLPRPLKYVNDDNSYNATSDLLTRLRLTGQVPWEALTDPTRPVQQFRPFKNAQEFARQELEGLFRGYWRDLLQSQPNHVEVLVEKNTVYHMALQVTARYQVTTRSARGLNSIDSFHEIAEAFRASGKERLSLIILSDLRPRGRTDPA